MKTGLVKEGLVSHDESSAAPVTLVIETSNPGAGDRCAFVALATPAGGLIDHEPLSPLAGGRDDLHPAIERLCERARVSPSRVSRVAVSVGPGGYTSLRVAVAAAVMIAEATGAELVELQTPAVVYDSAMNRACPPCAVALAGKGDACHLTRFDLKVASEIGVIKAESLGKHPGLRSMIADRHLPEAFRIEAERLGIEIHPACYDPACACRLAARAKPIDPGQARVRYAREPDAVTQWRARKSDRS